MALSKFVKFDKWLFGMISVHDARSQAYLAERQHDQAIKEAVKADTLRAVRQEFINIFLGEFKS